MIIAATNYTKSQLDDLAVTPTSTLIPKRGSLFDFVSQFFINGKRKSPVSNMEKTCGDRVVKLFFPIFNKMLEVDVEVESESFGFRNSTVETINDILSWTIEERHLIRTFLFDHAQRTKSEVDFGIDDDAPNHPCNFESGADGVEESVNFESITIYETDGLKNRFALLNCLPEWEIEHGAAIIIRNGKPIAVGDFQDDLRPFDV